MEKGCYFKQLIYIDGSGFLCEADDGYDEGRAGGEDQEAAEDGRRPEFSASVENGRAQNPDIKDKGQAGLGGARMKRMSWNYSDFRFFGVVLTWAIFQYSDGNQNRMRAIGSERFGKQPALSE